MKDWVINLYQRAQEWPTWAKVLFTLCVVSLFFLALAIVVTFAYMIGFGPSLFMLCFGWLSFVFYLILFGTK